MKPVELVERAIRNSSKAKDIVLDLFGGSGSTLIACEKSGRQARLIELDPKYVDVIVRRWEEYTGQEAYLEKRSTDFFSNHGRKIRHFRKGCERATAHLREKEPNNGKDSATA